MSIWEDADGCMSVMTAQSMPFQVVMGIHGACGENDDCASQLVGGFCGFVACGDAPGGMGGNDW